MSERGYIRDRSFYVSRPSGGRIKVHRESEREPGMAACDTHFILLQMDNAWDVERTKLERSSILCRRCWPM